MIEIHRLTLEELSKKLKEVFGSGEARGWIHSPVHCQWGLWYGETLSTDPDSRELRLFPLDEVRFFGGGKELRWFSGSFHTVDLPAPESSLEQRVLLAGKAEETCAGWTRLFEGRVGSVWIPITLEEGRWAELVVREVIQETEHGMRVVDEVIESLGLSEVCKTGAGK